MHDYTLKANTQNPQKNYATRRAQLMTVTERWETGFDHGYFKSGSHFSLASYQEYCDGWYCGWSAYNQLRNSHNADRIVKWEAEQTNYLTGKPFKVPYQLAPKKRFTLPVTRIDEVEAQRKNPTLNWQVELALTTLNVLTHEEGIEFSQAIQEALNIFPVSEKDLTEAYDNQVINYIGTDTIEFTYLAYHELSPQAQAESDLINTLLSNIE